MNICKAKENKTVCFYLCMIMDINNRNKSKEINSTLLRMVISKDGRQMKGFSLLLCSFRYYFIFIKMYPVLLIILKQNIFSE